MPWDASRPLGNLEGRGRNGRSFFRTEMDVLLFLSILFSCLLVITRVIHTGRLTFVTLIWNLFLAYIPYFITDCLARRPKWVSSKPLFAFFFVLWLLFIPNSFYILTDLFHLGDRYGGAGLVENMAQPRALIDHGPSAIGPLVRSDDRQAPMWFDLALILSCAWNGLLLGVLSVRRMEKLLLPDLSLRKELLFLYPIMWLNALGVYIGRYLRYNSWDVISDPFQLLGDIVRMIIHPMRYQYAWNMIFCFSVMMTLMYLLIKRVSKAMNS
jgi:uncharacterized membrane protein